MLWASYLKTAINFIHTYNGKAPLALELKKFFKANKKYGSRDRKNISELVFGFYRTGKYDFLDNELKCIIGSYLTENELYKNYYPSWPTENRYKHIQKLFPDFNETTLAGLFPELSKDLPLENFIHSFFKRPNTFIRIRKNLQEIIDNLQTQNVKFSQPLHNTISFAQNEDLDKLLPSKEDYVVQDISSQQVCTYFSPKSKECWWDACAASGGKSIALLDEQKNINLFVSDIRHSILRNLDARFKLYQHTYKQKWVVDLTQEQSLLFSNQKFDAIIVDVPCSGSGTWARSPEQAYFFEKTLAQQYQTKQLSILMNCAKYVKPGGKLFYITCSAFKAENEENMTFFLKENVNYSLEKDCLINNIHLGGDVMYIAKFHRN